MILILKKKKKRINIFKYNFISNINFSKINEI